MKMPPQLPLSDPNDVPEVYADELAGISWTNGAVHLTYNVVRPTHAMPGTMQNDPDMRRLVVSRLVLPGQLLGPMIAALQQVQIAMQQSPPVQQAN